jgi:hypothetical protein
LLAQKTYYRAVFEKNRAFLKRGVANMSVANLVSSLQAVLPSQLLLGFLAACAL